MTYPSLRLVILAWSLVLVASRGPDLAAAQSSANPVAGEVVPVRRVGAPWRLSRYAARVPAGVTQVVLEQRQGGGWKPVKVQHMNPSPSRVAKTFPVTPARGVPVSDLRVVAYRTNKFPAGFTHGRHDFAQSAIAAGTRGQDTAITLSPGFVLAGANSAVGVTSRGDGFPAGDAATVSAGPSAAAVESDIWKIAGHRLFFFNQFRGLQVFDLTTPTSPVRTGTLRMAARGDEMYLLDEAGDTAVLLGRSNEKDRLGLPSLFVLRTTTGSPALLQDVPLTGEVIDSRLIGSQLFLLTRARHALNGLNTHWMTPELRLETVDLTDPSAPVVLPALNVGQGWTGTLQAAGQYLLVGGTARFARPAPVAGQGSTNHTIDFEIRPALHLLNIASPREAPQHVKTFPLKGELQDKFKMDIINGAAVAVTSPWSLHESRMETWVETFAIEGDQTDPVGQLELEGARSERLHATRFDGSRLYVVTFRNIDPLFVVDLADPAHPTVSGELEIPGWSTYLEPLGDRLFAVGVEGGRVTASLFDVADPAAPALLSRLSLGAAGSGSWSEANYNEKAVQFIAEHGLALVPFQAWTPSGGSINAMQAITVGRDALAAGITISHESAARRATVMGDHLVSLSGQELLVVSRTENHAEPEAELSLAWRVDRVMPFGAYLLQLEDGMPDGFGMQSRQAMIRVTRKDDPDALLEEIELGRGPIVATAQGGDRLFVAQSIRDAGTNDATLRTWVLDVSAPPRVDQVTTLEHPIRFNEDGRNVTGEIRLNWPMVGNDAVEGVWVAPETLVWQVVRRNEFRDRLNSIVLFGEAIGRIGGAPIFNPFPGNIIGAITGSVTINVNRGNLIGGGAPPPPPLIRGSDKGAMAPAGLFTAMLLCPVTGAMGIPAAGGVIPITSDHPVRRPSRAFAAGGFIFASYDGEEIDEPKAPRQPNRGGVAVHDIRLWPPIDELRPSRLRSWLQVVDFSSTTPIVRDRVSIPGELASVSQADAQGGILLTRAGHADNSSQTIHACAYDGLTAYELDAHELQAPPWAASTSDGTHLYLATNDEASPGVTGLGYDHDTGKLLELGAWATTVAPSTLAVAESHLLASAYGTLETATIDPDGTLTPEAVFDTPVDLWLRVERTVVNDQGLWIPANEYGVEFLPWAHSSPGGVVP